MDNNFTFGGISTKDFPNMKIEKYPSTKGAARKMETISVDGRNGDLHIIQDAFHNTPQMYACYYNSGKPTNEEAHAVRAWLQSTAGYQRLEDTYDKDYFRFAMVKTGVDIENKLNKYGRFTVTFDCDPRCFLKSGEFVRRFSVPGIIHNPTDFTALPIITVYGTGPGTVTVNGTLVNILEINAPIILDCELQDAYSVANSGALENKNGVIKAPDFPVLAPGDNAVAFTGDITHIDIIPRWWTL